MTVVDTTTTHMYMYNAHAHVSLDRWGANYSQRPSRGMPASATPELSPDVSLAEKVAKIEKALALPLDASLPMPVAIKQANEIIGLTAAGPLPAQADALIVAMGI